MYGKTHTDAVRKLISKPGELNPMFGKHHSETSKIKISDKLSKYPEGVGFYDLNENLEVRLQNLKIMLN
jgi:hypothetical protein